ncbi:hypothetical protein FRA_34c06980 [Francisella sp. W12-1067]|nr:hypothetical protein FRA_34c06980 [Francisella sp. W12-1067]
MICGMATATIVKSIISAKASKLIASATIVRFWPQKLLVGEGVFACMSNFKIN